MSSPSILDRGNYQAATKELAQLLNFQISTRLKSLRDAMAIHPSFQGTQVIESLRLMRDAKQVYFRMLQRKELNLNARDLYFDAWREDALFWLLGRIVTSPTRFSCGQVEHRLCFAMLDEYLDDNESEKVRLEPPLSNRLEDFAIIHELWLMVHRHRPMPIPTSNRSKWIDPYSDEAVKALNHPTIFDRHIKRINPDHLMLPSDHGIVTAPDALQAVIFALNIHATSVRPLEQRQLRLNRFEEIKMTTRKFWKVIRETRGATTDLEDLKVGLAMFHL